MKKKLGFLAVLGAINLLLSTSYLSAGWTDDICKAKDATLVACCPECSFGCRCTL